MERLRYFLLVLKFAIHIFIKHVEISEAAVSFYQIEAICSKAGTIGNTRKFFELLLDAKMKDPHPMVWMERQLKTTSSRIDLVLSEFTNPITFLFPQSFSQLINLLPLVLEKGNYTVPAMTFICPPKVGFISSDNNNRNDNSEMTLKLLLMRSESLSKRLNLNSHVYILVNKGSISSSLVEFYNVNDVPIIAQVLTRANKIDILNGLLAMSARRNNLNSTTIRIIAQHDIVYKDAANVQITDGKVEILDGHCADAFLDVVHTLNFKYEAVVGKGWIRTVNNTEGEQLTGMGEQILNGEAELAISCSTMIPYRLEKLHFLQPIIFTQSMIFYREPAVETRNVQLLPFQTLVWMTLFLFWGIILTFTMFASNTITFCENWAGISDEMFSVLSCILLQGWEGSTTRTPCIKIVSLIAMLFSFVMSSFYTGAYVATVSSPSSLINTFEDLKKYGFQVFTDPTLSFYAFLFVNDSSSRQALWTDSKRIYRGDKDAIDKIMDSSSRYAFVLNNDNFFVLSNNNSNKDCDFCNVQKLKHSTRIKDSMFLLKGSPFIELLSHRIIMLIERGLNARYKRKYAVDVHTNCQSIATPGSGQLEIGHYPAPTFSYWKQVLDRSYSSANNLSSYIEIERSSSILLRVIAPTSFFNLVNALKLLGLNKEKRIYAINFVCPLRELSSSKWQSYLNYFQNQEYLNELNFIRGDDQVYFLSDGEKANLPRIFEVYSVLKMTTFKEINSQKLEGVPYQYDVLGIAQFITRRKNFQASIVRGLIQYSSSYTLSAKLAIVNGSVQLIGGFNVGIILDIQMSLNFSLEIVLGKGWPNIDKTTKDSRLTGMAKQLVDDEAEISISATSVFFYLLEELEVLPPIGLTFPSCFYREPPLAERNILVLPFQASVWWSMLILWIGIFILMVFTIHFLNQRHHACQRYSEMVTWEISVITLRNCRMEFTVGAALMISFTSSMFSSLVFTFYSGAFVATVSAPVALIRKFGDFDKNDFIVFTSPNYPDYAFQFVHSNESRQKIMESSIKNYANGSDIVKNIFRDDQRFAYVTDLEGFFSLGTRFNLTSKQMCGISAVKNSFPNYDAMLIKKHSPLKKIFTYQTLVIKEKGLHARHYDRYLAELSPTCLGQEIANFQPLKIGHYQFAFKIVLTGLILAFVILLYEVIEELVAFAKRRSNFHTLKLRGIVQPDPDYVISANVEVINGSVKLVDGLVVNIIRDFQYLLNFRLEVVHGKGWPRLIETPSGRKLSGFVEQLNTDEADLSISAASLFPFLIGDLSPLPPVSFTSSFCFYREPPLVERNIFGLPFESCVWYSLGCLWIIIGLSMGSIALLLDTKYRNCDSFSELISWVISIVSLRGWRFKTRIPTALIICFTSSMFSFLIYTFYTGAFVATVTAPIVLIKAFQDFERNAFEVFTNPYYPYYGYTFLRNNESKEIMMQNSIMYYTKDSEVIPKIQRFEKRLAFAIDAEAFYRIGLRNNVSERDLCGLSKLKGSSPNKDSMLLRKGSPLKKILTYQTIVMIERGLIHRHNANYLKEIRLYCSPPVLENLQPLEFQHCLLAFIIIFVGTVIALVIYFSEYFYWLTENSNTKCWSTVTGTSHLFSKKRKGIVTVVNNVEI
ncbi:unnamed protein product [Allacma fusca]|uniref:Uncharacterized protein n=1 Tax=Allacma fusca TaxID=39272 RepID=A0A8J2PQK7_9HEXA|nr:unnamed protein product [Allacma fusca]